MCFLHNPPLSARLVQLLVVHIFLYCFRGTFMGGNRGGTTTTLSFFDFVVPSSPDDDFLFLFPAAAAAVGASLEAPPVAVEGLDEEVSVV